MRCNICGQEFGDGAYCRHCNADRITASGNYSGGYNAPYAPKGKPIKGKTDGQSDALTTLGCEYNKERFILCYKCSNIIPSDSVFCPYCGIQLYVKCAKCGHVYSSQYKICNKCGICNNANGVQGYKNLGHCISEEQINPEIEKFAYVKCDNNTSIKLSWVTKNVSECDICLSNVNKDVQKTFAGLIPCGELKLTIREFWKVTNLGITNPYNKIVLKLVAKNREGKECCVKEIEITVYDRFWGKTIIL